MKTVTGINPDFADFDEIDIDAEDLIIEFEQGTATFEELRNAVGTEMARAIQERVHGDDGYNPDELFDNPQDF